MPPEYPILTDDDGYVAQLVVDDANQASLKYSSMGLDAFKSNARPANQPKPNTRFLNNIIRDTNTHNKAILARENAESQARLRDLDRSHSRQRADEPKQRPPKTDLRDTRKRMLGDIAAIIGGDSSSSRRQHDEPKHAKREEQDRQTSGRSRRGREETKRRSRSPRRDRHSDRRDHRRSRADDSRRSHSRRDRSPLRHRSPSTCDSSRDKRNDSRRRKHAPDSPSRSCSRNRHRSHRDRRSRSPRGGHSRRSRHKPERHKPRDEEVDSDPLDDFIGPAPASQSSRIHRRGRGVDVESSGIESRFAPDYDPRADIDAPAGETAAGGSQEDWTNSVEAFRDRQKWKQQGAARLRSAGFSEENIRRWEKGGARDESDVRWNERGGVREWDRGKVVGDDGYVSHKPDWDAL